MADPSEFGAILRARRLARGVGLRQLAREPGLSPTYLSRIERGAVLPPAEERVVEIATRLGGDADEWLALAGRVGADLLEIVRARPREMAALLRAASGLTAPELTRLAAEATRRRKRGRP